MREFMGWAAVAVVTFGIFFSAHTLHRDATGELYICERAGHVAH